MTAKEQSESQCAEYKTTCPYCGVGCGVQVTRHSGELRVEGDREHPANLGRLCVKGSSLAQTLSTHSRLLHPRVNSRSVTWPAAIEAVAASIRASIDTYGPESVGFYLSGQLLTEDYYAANKLAKGFIGTAHVDTNSRLCMSSAVAAHKRAFGADVVPGCYEDLEQADLLVLVGSNLAWNHPILYQRIKASSKRRRRIVVIDPRETATAEIADLHLRLKPDTDTHLFNGLLAYLYRHQAINTAYIDAHCNNFDAALAEAMVLGANLTRVAEHCDLPEDELRCLYRWFAETERTVTVFSQGVNQSSSGTDKGNAIINCHLATGRVGLPGASPFSVTGQPNAMGGREVGGLANTLAAHRDYDSAEAVAEVKKFWRAGGIAKGPGYKAVDLFDAVLAGKITVLWIMATNPAVSLPDNRRVRQALQVCPTVIVSDCVADTDTTHFADILLPAQSWGEKDGTVTNSERRLSRQRGFLPAQGQARPDWQIISQVATALGHGHAFNYQCPADVFREHAALSRYANNGARPFNLGALADISNAQYESMAPIQWPVAQSELRGTARLFGSGQFATADGRARFVAVAPPPVAPTEANLPLVVNSGRIRDQWHTMTRTGLVSRLWQHRAEPFIEVHPEDLTRYGVGAGQLAALNNARGQFIARVRASEAQRPGEVFIPIHWNRQFSSRALASELFAPVLDPVSGQPHSKFSRARLEPVEVLWEARLLCHRDHDRRWQAAHWSRVPLHGCDSWWLAGDKPQHWPRVARQWLGGTPQVLMVDEAAGRFRAARFNQRQLVAVLIVERHGAFMPDLTWLAGQFSRRDLDAGERRAILACRDAQLPDIGPIVCSCFQVGEKQVEAAVADGKNTTDALAESLKCGSNCGSCIPELKKLIARGCVQA